MFPTPSSPPPYLTVVRFSFFSFSCFSFRIKCTTHRLSSGIETGSHLFFYTTAARIVL